MDEPTQVLIERAQAADGDATNALFLRYRKRLRRGLSRMTAGTLATLSIESEDLLQDAMLAALRGIGSFEYRGEGSFLAWLLQTARHELLHRVRAANAKKRAGNHLSWSRTGEPRGDDASPSEVAIGNEVEVQIQRCVARLPERERTALVLARYLESSTDEIMRQMELPTPGAARALLSRAQARLARLLDEEGDPPSTGVR